jgi:hypothetical protein
VSEITREELKNFQQFLGLTDEDVAGIEASIVSQFPTKCDDLSSEKNVDYTRLRDLLAAGKWKEADEETLTVMLKAAGREQEGYLDVESIKTFPCADLRTIDRLWVKYSDGRLGFSVQKGIWESVGGKPDRYDKEIFKEFGARVGWCVKGGWIEDYSNISFSLNAPQGHLPVEVMRFDMEVVYWGFFVSLLSRRDL